MQPTETQVVPSPILIAGLTALLAVAGPYNAMTLELWQAGATPSRQSQLSDYTLATYSGYAAVAGIVFGTVYQDVDGSALALGTNAEFVSTSASPFVPNTIGGYLFCDSGVTILKAAYQFDNPVGISVAGRACPVAPFIRYSGN